MRIAAKTSRYRSRPCLETLEDRCLLSANVLQTNLVSDIPGVANVTDANLVNPWGISASPTGPFWISDSGLSTLYNTPGKPQPLVVSIPTSSNFSGVANAPTGTVYNIARAGNGFLISDGMRTAPATFLFATTEGTIAGWSASIDPTGKFGGTGGGSTHAVIAVDYSANSGSVYQADYRGLSIATDGSGSTYLYAANSRTGRVDVFDTNFQRAELPVGAFVDPYLPKTYTPFNIQAIGSQVYVTYAKHYSTTYENSSAPGNGFIDVFNLDGTGGHRLVSRGPLDAPWGLAIAPSSFGSLAGGLMVGNFGDGHINVFDPQTGDYLGALRDEGGAPVQIDGLWALKVGNGYAGGDANTVYFTAGLDGKQHGLFGALTVTAPSKPDGSSQPSPQPSLSPQSAPAVPSPPPPPEQAPPSTACDTIPNMAATPPTPTSTVPAQAPSQQDSAQPIAGQQASSAETSSAQASPPQALAPPAPLPLNPAPPAAVFEKPHTMTEHPAACPPTANAAVMTDSGAAAVSDSAAISYRAASAPVGNTPVQYFSSTYEVTAYLLPAFGAALGYYPDQPAEDTSAENHPANASGKLTSKQDLDGPNASGLQPNVAVAPATPASQLVALLATAPPLGLRGGSAHADAGAYGVGPPMEAPRRAHRLLENELTLEIAANSGDWHLTPEVKTEAVLQASGSYEEFLVPAPLLSALAEGTLSINLQQLKIAIDGFFARLENLADDLAVFPDKQVLVQWLLAGAAATGLFEFVRRRKRSASALDERDGKNALWYPMLVLAHARG